MLNKQRGLSIVALVVTLFVLIIVGIFGMKLVPSFLEYRAARSAIFAIAEQNPASTPAEVRRAFELRSAIDDVAIKPEDLEITKDGNQVVIGFAYRKEVPLWGNTVGLYINYAARTGGE